MFRAFLSVVVTDSCHNAIEMANENKQFEISGSIGNAGKHAGG